MQNTNIPPPILKNKKKYEKVRTFLPTPFAAVTRFISQEADLQQLNVALVHLAVHQCTPYRLLVKRFRNSSRAPHAAGKRPQKT